MNRTYYDLKRDEVGEAYVKYVEEEIGFLMRFYRLTRERALESLSDYDRAVAELDGDE